MAEHPDDHYSLTQFRYHYRQNTEARRDPPSTILADRRAGGEKLFLDFAGDTMGYTDRETGEVVRCQAFVATLPASDYGYLLFVPSQRTEDYVYAITQCLKHIGGVPRMLVPDNLKAAVVRTDRYEPTLNRVMEDLEYTRTLVKVYVDGELVATHRRDRTPGKYTIVEDHLASRSREYRGLSAAKYIERADGALKELGDVMRVIFYESGMPAETHYRTCDGLLNLQRSSDPEVFRTACETAIRMGRCNYGFIRSLVESRCAAVTRQESPVAAPPDHGNIRGKSQFK